MKASAGMLRRLERAQYQQVSAFERGRMIDLREAGLSYCDIAARTGHAAMTVMRVLYQCSGEKKVVRRDEQVLDHVM